MIESSCRVFLLRNNRLRGYIFQDLCSLSSIKILDFVNKKLNGFIFLCFNNILFGTGLSYDNDGYLLFFGFGSDNELGVYLGFLDI